MEGRGSGGRKPKQKRSEDTMIYLIISLGISYVSYQFGWIRGYEDRRKDIESNPFN